MGEACCLFALVLLRWVGDVCLLIGWGSMKVVSLGPRVWHVLRVPALRRPRFSVSFCWFSESSLL